MKSSAKVTVTVEVTNLGPWVEECTLSQVRDQAIRGAIHRVQSMINGSKDVHIVSKPVVSVVMVED